MLMVYSEVQFNSNSKCNGIRIQIKGWQGDFDEYNFREAKTEIVSFSITIENVFKLLTYFSQDLLGTILQERPTKVEICRFFCLSLSNTA